MRILDSYINKSVYIVFLVTVAIFCMLYILIDTTSTLDEILDRQISLGVLFKYYSAYLPIIMSQTGPVACLIAVLLSYSSMNNNNEIIAMRASGLSFWQLARPAIWFALFISVLMFWINEQYVPKANMTTEKIWDEHMMLETDRERKKQEQIRNMTFYGLNNRLYFIDSFNPTTYELGGITIIGHNPEQNIKEKIVALKGMWTGIAWKFIQCQITTFDPGDVKKPVKVKIYEEKLMDIKETPRDFMKQRLKVSSMNAQQLNSYIKRFSNSGASTALNNLRVDLYNKLASPIGCFVIVLLGLPFALIVRSRKGTTFIAIGIAVAIGFAYYVTNAVSLAFGKGGLFPPLLSALGPPMLFLGIALYLIEYYF